MKLPRVSRKTWIALGLLVVLVAVLLLTTREGFESASQYKLFMTKYEESAKTPEFTALQNRYTGPDGKPNGFIALFRIVLPLQAVGYYGDVVGDTLQVKQSQLESMLNGSFPIENVLTPEKAAEVADFMGQLHGGPPLDRARFIQDIKSQKQWYIDFPKGLYFILAKGQVYPSGDAERDANADMIIDELVKPDDTREDPQGLTKADKDAIVAHAKRVFAVAPSGPSPSTPSSSANYSATCNKCTVMNNQITCACDVLPK